MIKSLIISLILTLVIEIIVSKILGIREKDDFIIIICANIITNPIVVFIANCLVIFENDIVYNIVVIIMEIIVVFVEGVIFKKALNYKDKKPLLISFINNATSFLLGLVLSILF